MAKDKTTKSDKKKSDKKKVEPAKKKLKKDVKQMGCVLLMKHPELIHNARKLFRNENGTTIVQETVPRGDLKQEDVIYPRNQGDLTDSDLRGLAIYASGIVDPKLAQYCTETAKEDAVRMAIGTKDNGKYAGKINVNTFGLILDHVGKLKKASEEKPEAPVEEETEEEKKPTGLERGKEISKRQIEKVKKREEKPAEKPKEQPESQKKPEEATMDKKALKQAAQEFETKLAAVHILLGDGATEKEAAETFKCPHCGTKVLAQTGFCVKCKKKVSGGKEAPKDKKDKKDKEATEESPKTVVGAVEEIAGIVEKEARDKKDLDLFKIAYQLDQVCDVLDGNKEAATLESEPDETFMKKYFQAGARETDGDESFMKEFNNDNTTEVDRVVGNVSVQHKTATELPYTKID